MDCMNRMYMDRSRTQNRSARRMDDMDRSKENISRDHNMDRLRDRNMDRSRNRNMDNMERIDRNMDQLDCMDLGQMNVRSHSSSIHQVRSKSNCEKEGQNRNRSR